MKRLLVAAIVPLIASIGIALTPAMPVSAISTCGGTSLVTGTGGGLIRVPTVLDAHPNEFDCQLAEGNSGTAVSRLQIDLNDCFGENLAVDGSFGPLTKTAVEDAQIAEGLTGSQVDGIYGPITIDRFQYEKRNAAFIGDCDFILNG